MKRAVGLIFIAAATIAGFLSIRGTLPFMPVFGTSMEPVLRAGNLIVIKETTPAEIQVGDIIVYMVPSAIRDHYNYPPVVAHRVIRVVQNPGLGTVWRTKGDNTGEDPFTIRAQDLRGKVSLQIPYVGFPLLFFQSRQGFMFVIIGLVLLATYLYMDEITTGRRKLQSGIFAPVLKDNQRRSRIVEQRTQNLEKGMEGTQQALESFASAVAEYAKHLQSHTSAIQGLSEASHELKKSAAEQNKVLQRLAKVVEESTPEAEPPTTGPRVEATRAPASTPKTIERETATERPPRPGPRVEATRARTVETGAQPSRAPAPATKTIERETVTERPPRPTPRVEATRAKIVETSVQPSRAPAPATKTIERETVTEKPPAPKREIHFRVQKTAPPGCWKSRRPDGKA